MTVRLLETTVQKLALPKSGNRITYDAELKGFGVRVTAKGAKAFVLNYRVAGRERRLTIGSFPEWSAAAARKYAEHLKREIDLGDDPLAKRREERSAPTIVDLCQRYVDWHLPKKGESSRSADISLIERVILPRFGREKVAAIGYGEIERLHREITQSTPYQANRAVALLSKMFSLAIKWGFRADNPAKGVDRNPEKSRTRYASPAELARLAVALNQHPNQTVANSVRLLLFTGARKQEVLGAQWDQFDLDQGVWVKPAHTVKQRREHRIPLSRVALEMLRDMRASNRGCYLFPGKSAESPLTDIKKSWATICKAAALTDLRVHDLRHTFASYVASSGYSLPVVGALLGHTQARCYGTSRRDFAGRKC